MMLTEEMIAEDEKRWHARNIIAELGYCGKNIRHRKNITNDDIRFYAYIMRKVHALLKAQEAVEPKEKAYVWRCGKCDEYLTAIENHRIRFCPYCGQAVKWDD